MTRKDVTRVIAFLLVAAAMLVILCDLFETQNNYNYDKRLYTYRKLNENTVDAVYIGTSAVDRFWIAAQAYEDYGMVVYPLSTDGMRSWMFIHMLEEARAYQDPQLFIIDLRAFMQNNNKASTEDAFARKTMDGMTFFSLNRFKAAFKAMEVLHEIDEENPVFDLSYIFSFVKYHSIWSDEGYRYKKHIGGVDQKYGGFFMNSSKSVKSVKQKTVVFNDNAMEEISDISEQALYELIEHAKKNDLDLLFVTSPKIMTEEQMGRTNHIYQILDEEGIPYLDFYERDEDGGFTIDLNMKKDFYDKDHVNFYGAKKYTKALAAYLDEHYDLPNRSNDEVVQEDWDGVYKKITKKIKSYEKNK